MNLDFTAAQKLKNLLTEVSLLIEEYTAAVCPGCHDVCCKQRHGMMNDLDRRYTGTLGESVPSYDPQRSLDGPCQFMGNEGCTIPRWRRPWRCTSYFCVPLLMAMEQGPQKKARQISALIQEIVDIRGEW